MPHPHTTLHKVPPRSAADGLSPVQESPDNSIRPSVVNFSNLTNEENVYVARDVVERAAVAAATAAIHDVHRHSGRKTPAASKPPPTTALPSLLGDEDMAAGAEAADPAGGHDAPNWSRTKSSVILLSATVLYAVIAEILVNTVDVVLENYEIDEKFLGFTLFALVPNTTEFLVRDLESWEKRSQKNECPVINIGITRMPYRLP